MTLFLPLALALLGTGAAPAERIEMTTKSWGRPMSDWSIDARGYGTYTRPEPGVFQAKRLVTRRFSAGRAGFARIEKLVAGGRRFVGYALPCDHRATDMPYGTLRWTGAPAGEVRFDAGCQHPESAALIAAFERADKQVAAWAAKGKIVETRNVEKQ